MYIEIFIFQFIEEVFFNYSYTKFVFNFQFEQSLIKYVFWLLSLLVFVIIIIIIIIIINY